MASDFSSPNWLELPRDVTVAILQKLGVIFILKIAQTVCTQWRSICKEEPSMWRTIDMGNIGYIHTPQQQKDLENMCRQAMDRSCGGLIDLNIKTFCTNELLDYVTQRYTQIRWLRFVLCFCYITDEGLCEAAKRLLLLEDLELSYCHGTEEALKNIGECCPLLKSVKINQQGSKLYSKDDGEAMAIAKNMPELRHLQLFGNLLSNSGLEAIFDGCPHLESVDLRQCYYIDLKSSSSSSLGKRCAERIKDLSGPNDSTHDYGFKFVLYGGRGCL